MYVYVNIRIFKLKKKNFPKVDFSGYFMPYRIVKNCIKNGSKFMVFLKKTSFLTSYVFV